MSHMFVHVIANPHTFHFETVTTLVLATPSLDTARNMYFNIKAHQIKNAYRYHQSPLMKI